MVHLRKKILFGFRTVSTAHLIVAVFATALAADRAATSTDLEAYPAVIAAANKSGNTQQALRLSRQFIAETRAFYGDDRLLSETEFGQSFPITSRYGFRAIRVFHRAHQYLIDALFATGRHKEAMLLVDRELFFDRKQNGSSSIEYLKSLNKFSLMAKVAGDYDRALALFDESVKVSQSMYGTQSQQLAVAMMKHAILSNDLGRNVNAQVEAMDAIGMFRALKLQHTASYYDALQSFAQA